MVAKKSLIIFKIVTGIFYVMSMKYRKVRLQAWKEVFLEVTDLALYAIHWEA